MKKLVYIFALICFAATNTSVNAGTATVNNFINLYIELNNSSTDKIIFSTNITAGGDFSIPDRTLTIAGQGYTLNLYANTMTAEISKKLTIDNITISNGDYMQFLVNKKGVLSLSNVTLSGNYANDDYPYLIINSGTVNISSTIFNNYSTDIYNGSVVNLNSGDVYFVGGIEGEGTLNVKGAKVIFGSGSVLQQNTVKISKGYIAAYANTFDVDNLINNVKYGLYIDDGTLSNTTITGKGTTYVQGDVIIDSSSVISQSVYVPYLTDTETFTVAIIRDADGNLIKYGSVYMVNVEYDSEGNVTAYIKTSSGDYYTDDEIAEFVTTYFETETTVSANSLTANADSLKGVVTNNATLTLTGGTITKSIKGAGTTLISGDVVNTAKLYQDIYIDSTANDDDTVTLYSLTTNASLLQKGYTVYNSGKLILTGGVLSSTVYGYEDSQIVIDGKVTADTTISSPVYINEDAVFLISASNLYYNVENDGILQLASGTLYGKTNNGESYNITGDGTTQIVGTVTIYTGIEQYIDITKKGNFTVNADYLQGNVINAGILNITGGTIDIASTDDRYFAIENLKTMNVTSTNIITDIDNWSKLTITDSKITGSSDDTYLIENYKTLNIKSTSDGKTTISKVTGVAIYNSIQSKSYTGSLTISGNTEFSENTNSSGWGGVILNYNNETTYKPKITLNGSFTIETGSLYNLFENSIDNDDISTVFRSNSADYGGAIANLSGSITSKNYAYVGNYAVCGGAIINYNGTYTDKGSYYYGNYATSSGGAIYNGDSSTLKTTSSIFSSNSAGYGGAVYNAGTYKDSGSYYLLNTSTQNGGAIYNYISGKITLSKTGFFNNTSNTQGGAIYNTGTLTLKSSYVGGSYYEYFYKILSYADSSLYYSLVTLNSAGNNAQYGGGIYNTGTLSVTGTSFNYNTASYSGGSIYNTGALTVKSSVFSSNTAANGGAIYTDDKNSEYKTTVTDSTFTDNTASSSGGAIYANSGNITVKSSKFTGNYATSGGAVYNTGSLTDKSST
ncbi:MAG: hypothetical protein LUB59_06665, partial [Candidatus Gastranaerophilales bacterium]|nr:hypothetical protein [Candidatus Gastranaerophilales bacterium]